MISLTKTVGPDKSRSIKKVSFYLLSVLISFATVSMVFTLVLVSNWLFNGYAIDGSDLSKVTQFWLAILLMSFPFLMFSVTRAFYKYSSVKTENNNLKSQDQKMHEIMRTRLANSYRPQVETHTVIDDGTLLGEDMDQLNELEWKNP